jgi:hypothetical protein
MFSGKACDAATALPSIVLRMCNLAFFGGPGMRTRLPVSFLTRKLALCGMASGLVLLSGCGGPPKADIAGTLTIRGKTPNVEGLALHFLGSDGIPVATLVGADGNYQVKHVAVGEVRVAVTVTDPDGDKAWAARGQAANGGTPPPKARPPEEGATSRRIRPVISDSYRDPFKSGLKTTTRPGANTYNIDLQ